MKTRRWKAIAASFCLLITSCFILTCFDDNDDDSGSGVSVGDPDRLVNYLASVGMVVKEGGAGYFNMIQRCCMPVENPKLPSCFGFNPDAPYIAAFIPDADDQKTPNNSGLYDPSYTFSAAYRLDTNEALVLVGKTPPKVTYFSYVPYLFIRYDQSLGGYLKLFSTMTDTINFTNIKTAGTPYGEPGDPFDQNMVLIVTPDKETDRLVRLSAEKAGYSRSIINTLVIPPEIARLGLDAGKDEFMVLNRLALPPEDEASKKKFNDYLQAPGVRVFRVSPKSQVEDPLETPVVTDRESGANENGLADSVASLRQAILTAYSGYQTREYETRVWIPEGRECIEQNMECIGENHDTVYLRMPGSITDYPVAGPELFILSNDPDDFLIVYGVNHVKTQKAVYHSVSVYGNDRLNGIVTLTNRIFEGSTVFLLPNDPNADKLYAIKVARTCLGNENIPCLEVPTGGCPVDDLNNYGAAPDQELFLVVRAYVDPETGVGPSPDEIIFDQTIHLTVR